MISLFLVLGLISGCTRETGVLQAPQAGSEVKFFEFSEMKEFIKLHAAFLKGIKENTLFNPAGLIAGKIKGGKIFRLIPNDTLNSIAKEQSITQQRLVMPWEHWILARGVNLNNTIKEGLKGEKLPTPMLFFEIGKDFFILNALGFALIKSDTKGIWMPDVIELTGRAQILNTYLPEGYKLRIKFYTFSGKLSAELYVRNFARDSSLPSVDVNISPISMHDWAHQVSILYPTWLVEAYRLYAQDTSDFVDYLRKKYSSDPIIAASLEAKTQTYLKDTDGLFSIVGREIDGELATFTNDLMFNRRGEIVKYDNPPKTISSVKQTFKDRILDAFRSRPYAVDFLNSAKERGQFQNLVAKEIDAFLQERPDLKERAYFNIDKKYKSDNELATAVNEHIDYIASVIAKDPDAQKELIEGSPGKVR